MRAWIMSKLQNSGIILATVGPLLEVYAHQGQVILSRIGLFLNLGVHHMSQKRCCKRTGSLWTEDWEENADNSGLQSSSGVADQLRVPMGQIKQTSQSNPCMGDSTCFHTTLDQSKCLGGHLVCLWPTYGHIHVGCWHQINVMDGSEHTRRTSNSRGDGIGTWSDVTWWLYHDYSGRVNRSMILNHWLATPSKEVPHNGFSFLWNASSSQAESEQDQTKLIGIKNH